MCLWFDLLSNDVASCEVICGTTPTYYSSTTKYYSSTTLYYSSTTPVLLCTITYYSSTTLYYKELRQYYNVLPSTTMYYKVLRQYYSVLQRTTTYYSSTSLYYKVLRQYYNVLLQYFFETSFPMRGASKVTLQHHQILRLPRKMNVITDLRHIWNVISNKWSK